MQPSDLTPIENKAVTMVREQRVTIKWCNDDYTAASGMVKGDSALWRAGFDPEGRWCTCPAGSHGRDCSHALAVELEVARQQDEGASV